MGKKANILIFGGTTEGRLLYEAFTEDGWPCILSVATPYGKELAGSENIWVNRLDSFQMEKLMEDNKIEIVIDATHPFALEVSKHIEQACSRKGVKRYRIVREKQMNQNAGYYRSHEEIAAVLENTKGNILLTVGSKGVATYTCLSGFKERLYVRVLPMLESIRHCLESGIPNKHLICMQGPYSVEMNRETVKMVQARHLVTKDSGETGGFPEKLAAARQLGIPCYVLGRDDEKGHTYEQLLQELLGKQKEQPIKRESWRGSCENFKRFPLFMDLRGKRVLFVGGGKVTERRVLTLLPYGPAIVIAAPHITDGLKALVRSQTIQWVVSLFSPGMTEGMEFVFASTDDRQVNRQVALEAGQKNIPVNVADSREESGFWFPALFEKGDVLGAMISLSGNHKRLKNTKESLKQMIGEIDEANTDWNQG